MKTIHKGFTLIELLVVIGIIAILAGLIMVSFSGPQEQARDAQRRSDLKQYQTALENYASKHDGLYISTDQATVNISGQCATLGFVSTCPDDPDTTTNYKFISDNVGGAAARYVIYTQLEHTDDYWYVCHNGSNATKTSVPNLSDCL